MTGGEKERGEEDIGNVYGFQKQVAIKDGGGRRKRENEREGYSTYNGREKGESIQRRRESP